VKGEVTETPEKVMEVEDSTIDYVWKTSPLAKHLRYSLENCVGCSLCMEVCPWNAVSKGFVVEVAAGRLEGAPLINLELEKCTFCGLCVAACLFKAFNMALNGETLGDFVEVAGFHQVDEEKCLPCLLCEKICPREAIKVEVKLPRKEELVVYLEGKPEEAEGKISIDEEKCVYCGLCEILCDAIEIFWEQPSPPSFKPAIGIRVKEDQCDYCELCAEICPVEAIKVECFKTPERKISKPKLEGGISVDEEKCVYCGLCSWVCPVEAIKVEKPFEGKVEIVRLEKCDPIGCKNCFNICPVNVIYPVKGSEKIRVLEDFCIFCGACENACPEDVLKVERFKLKVREPEVEMPWTKSQKRQLLRLVGVEVEAIPEEPVYPRKVTLKIEPPQPPSEEAPPEWSISEEAERSLHVKAAALTSALQDKTLRIAFELGRLEKFLDKAKSLEGKQGLQPSQR